MALSLYLDDDDPWVIEQKIFDTLNGYLQPDSSVSATEAAQSIDSLFPTNRQDDEDKEDPGSFLWQLWERVAKTAQQIPHAHPAQDKLAALVKCLHTMSSRVPVVILQSWNTEYKLWEDLPMLGPTFQEQLDRTYYPSFHVYKTKRTHLLTYICSRKKQRRVRKTKKSANATRTLMLM